MGDEHASQVLTNIVDNALTASGVRDWADASKLQHFMSAANNGLWSAVGTDEYKYLKDDYNMQLGIKKATTPPPEVKGVAINPSNIYTQKELTEIGDNIRKFGDYFKKNAFLANDNQRPLCQDTGQVVVFLKVPQNITFEGKFINQAINDAVEKCYKENFFRKSVVNDSIFDRSNTKTNTPVIIYSEYIDGENVEINVLIKGGGAENKTNLL